MNGLWLASVSPFRIYSLHERPTIGHRWYTRGWMDIHEGIHSLVNNALGGEEMPL